MIYYIVHAVLRLALDNIPSLSCSLLLGPKTGRQHCFYIKLQWFSRGPWYNLSWDKLESDTDISMSAYGSGPH